MTIILSLISIFLLLLLYQQYLSRNKLHRDVQYISAKINALTSSRSTERILLQTEDKQLQQLLNEINHLLDDHQEFIADNARMRASTNRMLTNISHDLKTPLTVILGYIENLQHDMQYTAAERAVLLERAAAKVVGAAGLINTFFDLAKLESGDWELDEKRIHANEVCRQVILGYHDTLTVQEFDVSIDIPEEPLYFYGDEEAFTRVLNNLLSNAIRYGSDGKFIGLALSAYNGTLTIEVSDKGPGVEASAQNRIFERMYTSTVSKNTSGKGSGLGLTISKRLTEQMNGTIDYISAPYQKTAFILTFPQG